MPPRHVAAIDIGSNALRLAVAVVRDADDAVGAERNPEPELVLFRREPVRIGESVFGTGLVDDETAGRALAALRAFQGELASRNVVASRAVATSALRTATNGPEMIAAFSAALGIPVEAITAHEEARLVARAVATRLGPPPGLDLLVDLGGGSSQWTLRTASETLWSASFPIGAVRLRDHLTRSGDPERAVADRVAGPLADLRQAIAVHRLGTTTPDRLILVGGNAETLADLAERLLGRAPGSPLAHADLEALRATIDAEPMERRESALALPPNRADVIIPATLLFLHVLKELDLPAALVPRAGLKEGILVEMQETVLIPSPRPERPAADEAARDGASQHTIEELSAELSRSFAKRSERFTRWVHKLRKCPGGPTVHALRVAARRLLAVLDLAESALSADTPFDDVRGAIRTLRRALADARDLQASIDRLSELAVGGLPARVLALLLDRHLDEALASARSLGGRKKAEALTRVLAPLTRRLEALDDAASLAVAEAAGLRLAERRRALLEAVDQLDDEDAASIHAVRVALKKYRYAAEPVERFLSVAARAELPELAELQAALGAVQDLETLRVRAESVIGTPEEGSSLHAATWDALQRGQEETMAEAYEFIEAHDWSSPSPDELLAPFAERMAMSKPGGTREEADHPESAPVPSEPPRRSRKVSTKTGTKRRSRTKASATKQKKKKTDARGKAGTKKPSARGGKAANTKTKSRTATADARSTVASQKPKKGRSTATRDKLRR